MHSNEILPDFPEDDYSNEASHGTGSDSNNEMLPTSSISSDESLQIEKDSDMPHIHVTLGTRITKTRDVANTQQELVYAIGFTYERQLCMASTSTSSTQRTIKRKGRYMNLSGSVDN
jgi:hypothetical protein